MRFTPAAGADTQRSHRELGQVIPKLALLVLVLYRLCGLHLQHFFLGRAFLLGCGGPSASDRSHSEGLGLFFSSSLLFSAATKSLICAQVCARVAVACACI